jgi:photosystem II stability/assembly factor-like uncharacterized protein
VRLKTPHGVRIGLALAALAWWTVAAAPASSAPADSAELVARLPWRLIGPANQSGRVTDIAVPKTDPTTVYCATATGGVWKTANNGTTWTPIFDRYGSGSIGAIAVSDSNPDVVWVGTGEANASSYTSWGDGVYASTDGGRSFTHRGLEDTRHIGRIAIDPTDPNVVYVAAVGHLWGPNPMRGVFRTRDGGRSWKNVKFISDDVGFADLAMDPRNPSVLYAASYARRSDRFDDFDSVGINILPGGGVFKTTDGGDTWVPLTSGLPTSRVGRIGLSIARSQPDRVLAIVEVAPVWITLSTADVERLRELLDSDDQPPAADLAALRQKIDGAAAGAPEAVNIAGLSRTEQLQWRVLFGMKEPDAGGGVFRSDDAGKTWRRTNTQNEREGYYSQIRVDPSNADRVYTLMVRTWSSSDGGRTFGQEPWAFSSFLTSDFIHGDFHAMWIDPANSKHLIAGSDGGLYSTYDRGAHWEAHNMPLGQFVGIAVDMRRPYFVYGGLQDNGTWGGPSATRHRSGITTHDWYKVATSDGAYTQVDPTNANLIYTASQYLNLLRIDLASGARRNIRPRAGRGEPALRFNYVAPFVLSPHDPRTLYAGAQKVFKTTNRGDGWTAISPDLTKGKPNQNTAEGATITTIAESPKDPSVLWAGTDDGNLNVTRDGGKTWSNVAGTLPGAPKNQDGVMKTWVSRVEASHFGAGTAYVSLDGHRDDDVAAYLYRTDDFGQTWQSVVANLPKDVPVRVIREDRRNPNLLFVGTETSIFTSVDGGRAWLRLANNFPTVRVDDLVIHPRDPDLIAGTHGRSVYILDISALQELTPTVLESDMHVFSIPPATLLSIDLTRNKAASGARRFTAPNPYSELAVESDTSGAAPSGATIHYYVKSRSPEQVAIAILNAEGKVVRELAGPAESGINRVLWDLRGPSMPPAPPWQRVGGNDARRLAALPDRPGALVGPGTYQVRLRLGQQQATGTLRIEADR